MFSERCAHKSFSNEWLFILLLQRESDDPLSTAKPIKMKLSGTDFLSDDKDHDPGLSKKSRFEGSEPGPSKAPGTASDP